MDPIRTSGDEQLARGKVAHVSRWNLLELTVAWDEAGTCHTGSSGYWSSASSTAMRLLGETWLSSSPSPPHWKDSYETRHHRNHNQAQNQKWRIKALGIPKESIGGASIETNIKKTLEELLLRRTKLVACSNAGDETRMTLQAKPSPR
ncbi:hypothetical protein TIFTF001_026227 [Ficus carica]|uniref:Uncharacterized protein n=1 Tax=Ficus carica TaxID=3494 RepID=A0AA88IXX6_FICCA|nr:hypothetical protein TIFTF001_026227 [Ficus carica]